MRTNKFRYQNKNRPFLVSYLSISVRLELADYNEELPLARQEKYGIKRIRRRELLPPLPEGIATGITKEGMPETYSANEKFADIYTFITDGMYPYGEAALTHHFAQTPPIREKTSQQLVKEGLYFQQIFAPNSFSDMEDRRENFWTLKKSDDGTLEDYSDRDPVKEEDKVKVYSMNFQQSDNGLWPHDFDTPFFCFGKKNKNFSAYIESILNDSYARSYMDGTLKRGWEQSPIELIGSDSEDYETIYNDNYANKGYASNRSVDQLKEDGVLLMKRGARRANRNLETIKLILEGKNVLWNSSQIEIPIFQNLDGTKPLRWCDSQVALIPTKRSLNVLFFENE